MNGSIGTGAAARFKVQDWPERHRDRDLVASPATPVNQFPAPGNRNILASSLHSTIRAAQTLNVPRMLRALCVHAHYDDFEFTAAGTFQLWKQRHGDQFRARLVVCTDGAAGHHERSRAETAKLRLKEQQASADLAGCEFELLRYPDGTVPREGCLEVNPPLLAALWKAIRDFEPDYLFCPPLPGDPLAGVHVDHVVLADAIRKVAYLINVPRAFSPEYPPEQARPAFCKTPVIINVYDDYLRGDNAFDLAVNVEPVFPLIAEMSYCHQTQIREWLPWVGRHNVVAPADLEEWTANLRGRYLAQNRNVGITGENVAELFRVTSWGETPPMEALLNDFPELLPQPAALERLRKRLG